MATRRVPLGRAYELDSKKLVTSAIEQINPQGGTSAELMAQWHLRLLGDIGTVWNDYTGKGVSVGVYDEGVQQAHWDLNDNYDASKHVTIDGRVLDGGVPTGAHGTSVAGVIAAERNGRGGVGVAYDADVTGVNIFDPNSPIFVNGSNGNALIDALRQGNQFDVVNHSWGGLGGFGTNNSRSNPASFSSALASAFAYVAETGRDGLGTVTVMAAGNDNKNGGEAVGVTDRHAIAVAAFRQADGAASYYSNFGPHLLVSAPSNDFPQLGGTGVVTTDLLGAAGYNWSLGEATDYTDQFGGTSSATPVVSGVVSLMLDANENLGWRDVKDILAASAKMPVAFDTGPVAVDIINSEGDRQTYYLNDSRFNLVGGNANWNGGTMHYSNDYGYGAVDAYNAVRMAEVWSLFGEARTSANEVYVSQEVDIGLSTEYRTGADDPDIPKIGRELIGSPVEKSFVIDDNVALEHLDLTLNFAQEQTIYLDGESLGVIRPIPLLLSQIRLIAPDGTEVLNPVILPTEVTYPVGSQSEFTLSFAGLRGVETKGTWRVDFSAIDFVLQFPVPGRNPVEGRNSNVLTVDSMKMEMYGSTPTGDDVYTYTNEFFDMVDIAGERGRRTLTDTDGGEDWINAAAVSYDVKLSLVGGQATTFDGERAFSIARNSVIENAVTGDGDDTLIGNRFANFLVGMRGNDTLNGGAGDDWLIGGTGNDRFLFDNAGTSGKDLVLDFNRGDMIATQTALRGAGSDGRITVASNTLLLLDGTRAGDTAQLSQQGGAVIQTMGQKDGYFWYGFVSGTDIDSGDVIREESFQPTLTASGMVDAIGVMSGASGSHADVALGGTGLTGPVGDHAAFYLYDAMAGSMSGGVMLAA